MYSYVEELCRAGLVRIASYDEFLLDEYDEDLYRQQFLELYVLLGEYYVMTNSKKRVEALPEKCDIFTYRKAGTSIGDVHVILMASYSQIPVIFTEDGDISALKFIAKMKINSESYQMNIYNALEALGQIIAKPDCPFSKKDIETILNEIGNAHIVPNSSNCGIHIMEMTNKKAAFRYYVWRLSFCLNEETFIMTICLA